MLEASAMSPRMVPTTAPALGPAAGKGGGVATNADTTGPPAALDGPGTYTVRGFIIQLAIILHSRGGELRE
jgi:hypothetical protein